MIMKHFDRILTFYLNNQHLGMDIRAIKEINRNVTYTPLSDAPDEIVGLLNMRGQVVTIFDLTKLMGLNGSAGTRENNCIILKNRSDTPDYSGFLIDHPGSVIDVSHENIEPPPANIVQPEKVNICSVVRLEDDAVMIVEFKLVSH